MSSQALQVLTSALLSPSSPWANAGPIAQIQGCRAVHWLDGRKQTHAEEMPMARRGSGCHSIPANWSVDDADQRDCPSGC